MSNELPSDSSLPSTQGGTPHGGAGAAVDPGAPYGNYFVATYPPFSEWRAEAAGEYRELLSRRPDPEAAERLGLYVHIPFCVERCRYCYYLSYDGIGGGNLARYVDCLLAELANYACSAVVGGRRLDFVYFGGGTPSLLSEPLLERLLAGLEEILPWSAAREVTFECAPKSVTPSKLERLRKLGVTRLSLGVQQLDDEVLARNGRVHLVRDVESAYRAVRAVGFEVVNLDLMVGLVGESEASLFQSLERVVELEPDCVTAYQMEIPLNTPLYRDLQSGAEPPAELADWEEKHRRLVSVFERLAEAGYEPISAYGMVRDRSRHDFVYQREQYHGADLVAIGASAFGYLQGMHYQNEASLNRYVERVEAGAVPAQCAYRLDRSEQLVRELVLQLKLGGVERRELEEKFDVDVVERFRSPLERLAAAGWLAWDDDRVALTAEGLVRVDHLIPAFYPAEHRGVRYS